MEGMSDVCYRCGHDRLDHGMVYYACLCYPKCMGFVHEDDPDRPLSQNEERGYDSVQQTLERGPR